MLTPTDFRNVLVIVSLGAYVLRTMLLVYDQARFLSNEIGEKDVFILL